jgi:UDP-glucose/GDP-mannose dehydrogenase family, NAD binding domain
MAVCGRAGGATFRVVFNPDFLREGTAVADLFHPDRIVVGVEDETEPQLREIYRPSSKGVFAARCTAPNVLRVPRQPSSDYHCERRTDQARVEFLPRPEDLLRQRDRRSV